MGCRVFPGEPVEGRGARRQVRLRWSQVVWRQVGTVQMMGDRRRVRPERLECRRRSVMQLPPDGERNCLGADVLKQHMDEPPASANVIGPLYDSGPLGPLQGAENVGLSGRVDVGDEIRLEPLAEHGRSAQHTQRQLGEAGQPA
jgi:hypothetical protein